MRAHQKVRIIGAAILTLALPGLSSVAVAQNQPPPVYQQQPPPGYQQPPPNYPPPAYQQPAPGPGYYPPPPPPPRGFHRDGLLFGVGVGLGAISAENCGDFCGGALSLQFDIGGMITPTVGLMFDLWANLHPIPNTDNATVSNTLATFAGQFWLSPTFWLKGGLGIGNTEVSQDNASLGSSSSLGMMGGAGIELFQSNSFAFDLQARLGVSLHSDSEGGAMSSFAILAGFNWY